MKFNQQCFFLYPNPHLFLIDFFFIFFLSKAMEDGSTKTGVVKNDKHRKQGLSYRGTMKCTVR